MLQGVNTETRKRHHANTPNFLQGVIRGAQKCHILFTLKGAAHTPQQCYLASAPTSFIWCQHMFAVMPAIARTKGRVTARLQQCQSKSALPNQFNGVIVKTQKCRDIVAPRGEPSNVRRDASIVPLSPAIHRGTLT